MPLAMLRSASVALVSILAAMAPLSKLSAQANSPVSVVWTSPLDMEYSGFDNLIDDTFRFEAGYFDNRFVPTAQNTTSWKPNWRKLQSSFFRGNQNRVDSKFNANRPYNGQGQRAYVWGFSGNRWILLTHTSWIWPSVSNSPSLPVTWDITKANTVIFGSIQDAKLIFADAGPVSPPDTSWAEWTEQFLTAGPSQFTDADVDLDSIPNLLEFALGLDPRKHNPPPKFPTEIVNNGSNRHLQVNIPRRGDHLASLRVEVSSHPAGPWYSGPEYTTTVTSTPTSLVVRDNIAISPQHPRRFIRLKVEEP